MKITELRPMLWTEDFAGTIDFYTDVLGFTTRGADEKIGWATLPIDDVPLMISRPNEHVPLTRSVLQDHSI